MNPFVLINLFIFIYFFCGTRASHRCGLSVAEHRLRTRRLSGHGSRAQPLRGMWDLPGPRHEPVSPASAGRVSTIAPPGKPPPGTLNREATIPLFVVKME